MYYLWFCLSTDLSTVGGHARLVVTSFVSQNPAAIFFKQDQMKFFGGKLYAVVISLNCEKDIFFSKYKSYLTFIESLAFAEDYSMHIICTTALSSHNNLYVSCY